jgi:hypothetical protein
MTADGGEGKTVEEATGISTRQVRAIEASLRARAESPAGSFALFAPGVEDLVTVVDDDDAWLAALAGGVVGAG